MEINEEQIIAFTALIESEEFKDDFSRVEVFLKEIGKDNLESFLKDTNAPDNLVGLCISKGWIESKTVVESIKVSYGMTLNIGNFESFRADAEVTISSKNGKATYEEMYDEGWNIVSSQLRSQVAKVREKTKKSGD